MKKNFSKTKKYKNKCIIMSPYGAVPIGRVYTGKQWEFILVYKIGSRFEDMFELVI